MGFSNLMSEFVAFIESVFTNQITLVAILFFIIVAFMREWVVSGRRHRRDLELDDNRYQEMRLDRDQWRTLALSSTTLAESAVKQAVKK